MLDKCSTNWTTPLVLGKHFSVPSTFLKNTIFLENSVTHLHSTIMLKPIVVAKKFANRILFLNFGLEVKERSRIIGIWNLEECQYWQGVDDLRTIGSLIRNIVFPMFAHPFHQVTISECLHATYCISYKGYRSEKINVVLSSCSLWSFPWCNTVNNSIIY